jgi:hypothetical protein
MVEDGDACARPMDASVARCVQPLARVPHNLLLALVVLVLLVTFVLRVHEQNAEVEVFGLKVHFGAAEWTGVVEHR